MKRVDQAIAIVADAALIVCAMLATVCAIPSAFSVPFEIGLLVCICVPAALLLSGWMHLPRVGVACGAVFLLGIAAYGVFSRTAIVDGARYLWYSVLKPLSTDFSFLPVPAPIGEIADPAAAVTALLAVAAAVIGLFIAFALIRGKLLLLTVLLPLPPFLLSLIYTNQPPALWTSLMLLLYCGGALAGHGLRKSDAPKRGRFAVMVIPLLLGLALLLPAIVPEKSFTPIPFEQRQQMLGRAVGRIGDTMLSWFRSNPKNVDLGKEGERINSEETAFSVSVTEPGEYLMRTHSYGHYEKGMWMAAPEYEGEWRSMAALGNQRGARVNVLIRDAYSGERIVPYGFTVDPEVEIGENFVHAQGRTAYLWTTLADPSPYATHQTDENERAYINYATKQYTMPAGKLKTELRKLLEDAGIRKSRNIYETALSVAAFVRGSGVYTLTPGEAPAGIDFVQYFLTQNHKGYCVHFASATTALLQSMDIPARYTVGYHVVIPIGDAWTDIPESAAHAWTEIYLTGVGWVPIESTAGFGNALSAGRQNGGYTVTVTASPTSSPTPTPTPTPSADPNQTQSAETSPQFPQDSDMALPLVTPTPEPGNDEKPFGTDSETVVGDTPQRVISAWWLLLLLIPAAIGVWFVRGGAVRRRRKHAFLQKNTRAAILQMARYHARLECYGVRKDPDLDAWAEEAAFSNHEMTEERRTLYRRIVAAQKQLYRDAPLKRLYVRWIRHIV